MSLERGPAFESGDTPAAAILAGLINKHALAGPHNRTKRDWGNEVYGKSLWLHKFMKGTKHVILAFF
jgi:hypothetical protein